MTPIFHALLRGVPLRDIKLTESAHKIPFLQELSDGRAKVIQPKYGENFGQISFVIFFMIFNVGLIFFGDHLTDLAKECIPFWGFNALFFKNYFYFIFIFFVLIGLVIQQLYDLHQINKRPEFYPTKCYFSETISVKVDEKLIKFKKRMVFFSIFIVIISVCAFILYLGFPIQDWSLENQQYNQKCLSKLPPFDTLK